MIEVSNLVKRYGDKIAVNNISFTVHDGEVTGFLGPNGAGKTTTMNILTGYISSNEGSVKINGLDILDEPVKTKRLIGYLPEHPPLYLDMTVREYLLFVCGLKDYHKHREAHIKEICELVKITHVYDRLIKNLSKGYRQRVGLAQALIGNSEIIILDEPTVGLDPKEKIEIGNLIRCLGKNHTVILSSHVLAEIQAVCDRIIVINRGIIVANDKTENLGEHLSQKHSYSALIEGPAESVAKGIGVLPGVVSVKRGERAERGVFEYTIETEKGSDIRRSLFQFLSKNNYPLLGLRSLDLSLEEIFIKLITEDDAAFSEATKKERRKKGRRFAKSGEGDKAGKAPEEPEEPHSDGAEEPGEDKPAEETLEDHAGPYDSKADGSAEADEAPVEEADEAPAEKEDE